MYATTRGGFKNLLHPYYIVNIILSLLYVLTKKLPYTCGLLYEQCEIELQEYEILIFLAAFITMRNKRQFSVPDYVAHFCMFAKLCNLFMFWRHSLTYATVYGVLWLFQAYFLFQPVYSGPESVCYFHESNFAEVVERGDPRVTWVVAFYTVWSPGCIALAPIFSELSHAYSGYTTLRFGKVDVARCSALARQVGVDTSTWSKQLPTIIVFRGGREIDRRPGLSSKTKKVVKFTFTWENIVAAFSLNDLYAQCKQQEAQIRRSKAGLEKAKAAVDGKKDK
ncbi:unnamed protein product [Hydatigera taeniaeformis]|uniref:Thioredoxin domain-containing protein n=1 Tax=Hydatigena taeniaeformis TaxID=6205 RepID=A0A0R3XCY0_HYDTA|nr:unnamed protein product [Hydatigera taeniaeformis]